MILLGAFALGLTLAYAQPVTQAPPPIAFEPWRETEVGETSRVYDVAFPSAVPSGTPANDVVRVRAILPSDRTGPLPVVVCLHFWGAVDWRLERALAADLNSRGIAAVLVALPYHLGRTPPGARSGELAIQADPEALIRTMTQSVSDVRRTIDWVQSRPEFASDRVGLAGTSLGAIVSSLVFALDDRVGPASFLLGGADLASILWNSSRLTLQRESLRSRGFTAERMRDALRPIEPLGYLKADGRPTYVIGARFDTVVPAGDTQKLIDALGRPTVLWIETGHYGGAFVERALLRSIATFFAASMAGREFTPPRAIFAPTIRVGLVANNDSGLQVGAAVDLWRSGSRGQTFACGLLTPRGAQGFIGYELARGISVGISITRRRTTPGAFWNLVL